MAALAVLAAATVVILAPGMAGRAPVTPTAPDGSVVLPQEIGGMSMLTASLSDAPLRQPGLLVLRHAVIGTFFGLSQVVVVGRDGRTYRRVDLAEERGGHGLDGEFRGAQALLSPDGRHLAIGRYRGSATEIPVLDLVTGERRDYRLDKPTGYHLVAWSHDGRKLAMAVDEEADPADDHFQKGEKFYSGYPLAVLDLVAGEFSAVPEVLFHPLGRNGQFAPDGRLGVPTATDVATSAPVSWMTVVEFGADTGRIAHTLRLANWWAFHSWTPSGEAVLRSHERENVVFRVVRPADGADVRPPLRIPRSRALILGWRSPTVMLVLTTGQNEPHDHIVAVDLEAGRLDVVSSVKKGFLAGTHVADVATDLLAVAVGQPASPERGPWPTWVVLTLAIAGLIAIALIVRRVRCCLRGPAR